MQPENLLLDAYGNLKVSDFGLSALSQQVRVSMQSLARLRTLCRCIHFEGLFWSKYFQEYKDKILFPTLRFLATDS